MGERSLMIQIVFSVFVGLETKEQRNGSEN